MMRGTLAMVVGLIAVAAPAIAGAAEALSFTAADGVRVFADYYAADRKADNKSAPLILLFHQAGSNRGEYATIAPALAKLGFDALAIDQRSGGNSWGRVNETVEHLGHSSDFAAAIADLEAALQWARSSGHDDRLIVWGSSYSAALVFPLAAKHKGAVSAVLAFSPGEYLGGAATVRRAAAQLTVPIFVTSAKENGEIAAARTILDAAPASVKTQFVPRVAGVHGSSTLRSDRNPKGVDENWDAVKAFLAPLALSSISPAKNHS
jgi:alpha-beta hydrolase superfamily lysophospholipase